MVVDVAVRYGLQHGIGQTEKQYSDVNQLGIGL